MSKRKMVLSMSQDTKTVKGLKQGYLTGILYLAPHTIAGDNICPNAVNAGCVEACLYSAGRGAFNSVQQARINRTNRFHNDNDNFMLDLRWSIAKVVRKAEKEGLKPCIRLNGTSDIDWSKQYSAGLNMFEHFQEVQFYDYTKVPKKSYHDNYHITFSYSGATEKYKASILQAIKLGMNIAVVFMSKNLPLEFLGKEVVNGEGSDLRFLDKADKVVGLYAKGKAKKDTSGFVVHNNMIPTF